MRRYLPRSALPSPCGACGAQEAFPLRTTSRGRSSSPPTAVGYPPTTFEG